MFGRLKREALKSDTSKAAITWFEAGAIRLVEETAARLLQQRQKLHLGVDNEAELKTLSSACDGRLAELATKIAAALDPEL